MMVTMVDEEKKESKDDDTEELFEKMWKNWESRRRCEKTHVPEYLKHGNEKN
jgi:hypothetical protein